MTQFDEIVAVARAAQAKLADLEEHLNESFEDALGGHTYNELSSADQARLDEIEDQLNRLHTVQSRLDISAAESLDDSDVVQELIKNVDSALNELHQQEAVLKKFAKTTDDVASLITQVSTLAQRIQGLV